MRWRASPACCSPAAPGPIDNPISASSTPFTGYRGFFDARAQAAIVYPPQDFGGYRVLIAPAIYAADDELLERLVRYAQDGGHLMLSFRGGYGDEYARARWQRAPGLLRSAVGASYSEYSNLLEPLPLREVGSRLTLPAESRGEAWADGLELEGAESLAEYDHPHFGRFPAITTHAFGKGRVTYAGTLPNAPLSQALARWVLDDAGLQPLLADPPPSVRANTARGAGGKRLWFLSNWSGDPATLASLPASGTELGSEERLRAGDMLELAPWDMKILVEH